MKLFSVELMRLEWESCLKQQLKRKYFLPPGDQINYILKLKKQEQVILLGLFIKQLTEAIFSWFIY